MGIVAGIVAAALLIPALLDQGRPSAGSARVLATLRAAPSKLILIRAHTAVCEAGLDGRGDTKREKARVMDAMTLLLEAKDREILRLAETVLRIVDVLDQARRMDHDTELRLEMLRPEVEEAHRTYLRLNDEASTTQE